VSGKGVIIGAKHPAASRVRLAFSASSNVGYILYSNTPSGSVHESWKRVINIKTPWYFEIP
jgi:hypothetical protein